MNALEMLNQLDELYAHRDLLSADWNKARDEVVPDEVKAKLEDIEFEFGDKAKVLDEKIDELRKAIQGEVVLIHKKTIKGSHFQAVYAKGRVTWDTKALDGYAAGHPEINQFRKEGEPSVSIRRV